MTTPVVVSPAANIPTSADSRRRLRIFIIHGSQHLTDHSFNGDGLVAWGFISELARRGHIVHVATDHLDVQGPIPPNLTLVEFRRFHRNSALHYLSYMRRVRLYYEKIAATEGVDVAHQMNPVVRGLSLALLGKNVPVVLGTYVGDWVSMKTSPSYAKPNAKQRCGMLFKAVVDAVQQHFASSLVLATPHALKRVPLPFDVADRIEYLHHGVDAETYNPIPRATDPPRAARRILYVGSIARIKGVFALVNAFARVAIIVDDASLVMLGDGPAIDALKAHVCELGLSDRITFPGRATRSEVAGWLRSSDVLCAPSYGEPYGQNVLEAMASGKPVVLTTAGGHRYLGDDNGSIRVEPGNVEELAAALADVLLDPSRSNEMGQHNRNVAEQRHAWPKVVDLLENIYERTMQRSRNGMIGAEQSPGSVEHPVQNAGAKIAPRFSATQLFFAANAFEALAVGFGVAGIAMSRVPKLQRINAAAALACGLGAASLRLSVRKAATPFARDQELSTKRSDPTIDYSIIVPVWNRPRFVEKLLGIIADQVPSWSGLGRGEIVVIDDGSVDDTAEVATRLAATMPLPTRVVSIEHVGPGSARNAGFVAASGKLGVSIDSDCTPDPDWLRGLLDAARSDEKTAAFSVIRSIDSFTYPLENVPDRKGYVSASFAMDREAFCKLGGFYPAYGMSHEDLDLVQALKSAGFRVVRAESHIYHPVRRENPASIWRAGLNSKYANLFARRHGRAAHGMTTMTPYYFFGVAGNYGSSLGMLIWAANAVAVLTLATGNQLTTKEIRRAGLALSAAGGFYALALTGIGVIRGAGIRRLPAYVATLASLQIATTIGRLRGTIEYGLLLL